jgi:hypothetical protein
MITPTHMGRPTRNVYKNSVSLDFVQHTRIMPYLTYLVLQRQLSHLNGHTRDHRQVYTSYIFYDGLCLVLCLEHFFS